MKTNPSLKEKRLNSHWYLDGTDPMAERTADGIPTAKDNHPSSKEKWEIWLKGMCGCIVYHMIGSDIEDMKNYKFKTKRGCPYHD